MTWTPPVKPVPTPITPPPPPPPPPPHSAPPEQMVSPTEPIVVPPPVQQEPIESEVEKPVDSDLSGLTLNGKNHKEVVNEKPKQSKEKKSNELVSNGKKSFHSPLKRKR